MVRKIFGLGILVALVSFIFTGCGGGSDVSGMADAPQWRVTLHKDTGICGQVDQGRGGPAIAELEKDANGVYQATDNTKIILGVINTGTAERRGGPNVKYSIMNTSTGTVVTTMVNESNSDQRLTLGKGSYIIEAVIDYKYTAAPAELKVVPAVPLLDNPTSN